MNRRHFDPNQTRATHYNKIHENTCDIGLDSRFEFITNLVSLYTVLKNF